MNDFYNAIVEENRRGYIAVIPDIKYRSPKEGNLMIGRDPLDISRTLVKNGAPVLSVVTEKEHFGGDNIPFAAIADLGVPVLRKDFFTGTESVEETKNINASALLLIYATMDHNILGGIYCEALALGLEPLVEIHTSDEMELAAALQPTPKLIGINNRNIASFEMDDGSVSRTVTLASQVPAGSLLISESGIYTPDDVRQAAKAGANAVLVGTSLLQAQDIGAYYQSLRIRMP